MFESCRCNKMEEIEQYIADALIGKSYPFSVEERHFALYPVTLGKLFLTQRMVKNMEVNDTILRQDISLEALRLAKEKREECLTLIYYHISKTKEEVFDVVRMNETKAFFDENMSDEDIASLLIMILTADKTEEFFEHLGIKEEQRRLNAVMRVKKSKNSVTFGGKSQFGLLLDTACERYGWTKDYVVWEVDYASLRLMIADKINSVFLSDEEVKRVPAWALNGEEDVIKGDKENMEAIKSMDWK